MGNVIAIGRDRLPTLEILGKEYPYDMSSKESLERLKNMDAGGALDTVVTACKAFITSVFCGNTEPAERIAEVYKDSVMLWLDASVQIGEYVVNPNIKALNDRVANLRRAADK